MTITQQEILRMFEACQETGTTFLQRTEVSRFTALDESTTLRELKSLTYQGKIEEHRTLTGMQYCLPRRQPSGSEAMV